MATQPDNQSYAKVDEVKSGDILIADGGFTCIDPNSECTVHLASNGFYVTCQEGRHYLDGQLDEGDEYIGFRLAKATPTTESV